MKEAEQPRKDPKLKERLSQLSLEKTWWIYSSVMFSGAAAYSFYKSVQDVSPERTIQSASWFGVSGLSAFGVGLIFHIKDRFEHSIESTDMKEENISEEETGDDFREILVYSPELVYKEGVSFYMKNEYGIEEPYSHRVFIRDKGYNQSNADSRKWYSDEFKEEELE